MIAYDNNGNMYLRTANGRTIRFSDDDIAELYDEFRKEWWRNQIELRGLNIQTDKMSTVLERIRSIEAAYADENYDYDTGIIMAAMVFEGIEEETNDDDAQSD